MGDTGYETFFRDTIEHEACAISELRNKVPEGLDQVVDKLLQNHAKLIVTGIGKSGIIGRKIAATLSSTGTSSFFVHPGEAYHGDLGMIGKKDIVLAISYSGETEEVLKLISYIKQNGNYLMAMTGKPKSTLARNSHFCFDVSVSKEACPLQLAPTSSTTATLVIGDALAMTLMKARNFKPDDFAVFHPGGSLGKRLLTTVDMVMKSENLPFAKKSDSLVDIVQVIGRGRCGLAIVIDEDNKLHGVISDGDLRRTMENEQNKFFELEAKDIVTRNPKTIPLNAKLLDAEELMTQHKINSLLVEENGLVQGVVQIYDL
jgi:arabinose-5-phosphate isomerase